MVHKADTFAKESARHAHVVIRGRDMDGNVLRFAKPFVKDGFRSIARDMVTEKFGPLNDRELATYRERFERNRERNERWKSMERDGASMADRRAFAKAGHAPEQPARPKVRGYHREHAHTRA